MLQVKALGKMQAVTHSLNPTSYLLNVHSQILRLELTPRSSKLTSSLKKIASKKKKVNNFIQITCSSSITWSMESACRLNHFNEGFYM